MDLEARRVDLEARRVDLGSKFGEFLSEFGDFCLEISPMERIRRIPQRILRFFELWVPFGDMFSEIFFKTNGRVVKY